MSNPKFDELLEKMRDLHNRKNSNYATNEDPLSNFREAERLGVDAWLGILVRISDKWCRICNLTKGMPDQVNESMKDTLTDMAVYSLLCILLLEEKNEKYT